MLSREERLLSRARPPKLRDGGKVAAQDRFFDTVTFPSNRMWVFVSAVSGEMWAVRTVVCGVSE